MNLGRVLASLSASALLVSMAACTIEKAPEPTSESDAKIDIQVQTEDSGAFERLGERMDKGAKKLDKSLEKGAEHLGEAMEKAGQNLQETAQEAQARRAREEAAITVPKVDVDVTVEQPKP